MEEKKSAIKVDDKMYPYCSCNYALYKDMKKLYSGSNFPNPVQGLARWLAHVSESALL